MSSLKIEHSWVDLNGAERPEIQATFANVKLSIGDEIITRVAVNKSQITRNEILVPMYALAEWIVANWWPLIEESEVSGRPRFNERHSMMRAGAGYCFPDLHIVREGNMTRLQWHRHAFAHTPIEFIAEGTEKTAASDVEAVLADVVFAVDDRLSSVGIHDSWLQKEWTAIKATECDPDELEFCRAAAWLGLDPYEVDDEAELMLCGTWQSLPESVREDVYRASTPPRLQEVADWILKGVEQVGTSSSAQTSVWNEIRQRISPTSLRDKPWLIGYEIASDLRALLKFGDKVPAPLEDVDGPLPIVVARQAPDRSLDGVFGGTDCGQPRCYSAKSRSDSKRFLFARGLFEYLYEPKCLPAVLSSARTERQQRSRAFAAELLAPAALLRASLSTDYVTRDDIDDVAAEFDVSSYVIEHQIQNHNLARIVV